MVKEIIEKFHLNNTIVEKVYQKYLSPWHQKRQKHKHDAIMHKVMDAYGLEALKIIYDIAKKHNVNIWFEYGSLLGAYRDKGFIPYDFDIDLSMYHEDYSLEFERSLFDAGFSIRRMFYMVKNLDSSNRMMTEITLCYHGLYIDVFFNFRDQTNMRKLFSYTGKLGQEFANRNIYSAEPTIVPDAPKKEIDFMGIKFSIPENANECLESIYGKSYMTPIRDWVGEEKYEYPYQEAYGEMYGAW